ncbi:hypothetical protein ORIO_11635 [Cereibacter azotoformans]|uniref:Uncharacterized protein n=2 Tax=Cereibacter TaxID=1653176 RepID=A0A2T5K7M6_9RHOB|nr:hypothetical protein [Cereibacter azotoformans]AXQ94315.1 hypothetical protein D0Z66_11190 [Cereibacter sphaeroides]MBO4167865.1 hypothetical protein [Cereibacter azotoformans]PTR18427.1 hypothetical protein C8J28_108148 [Cereibacter azotoformans]UIJ29860.1 hypothetical protein LV780_11170 [Cereibacter azotoformans]ULB10553.1 hypothetical protein ORIO_11635 [Cereibacter azotoformans]
MGRALLLLLALAACADPNAPHLGLGVGVGPGGVSVHPRMSTRVGATSVGVSPYGASVGTGIGNVGVAVGGGF